MGFVNSKIKLSHCDILHDSDWLVILSRNISIGVEIQFVFATLSLQRVEYLLPIDHEFLRSIHFFRNKEGFIVKMAGIKYHFI